ncbi:hypothetical protein [Magnetospirillum sulfuroxidans]|uniref:SPOR domain-containing protein n=1 Tax=Magnetospirillum sulfuroxidans TaxID=611300 RepID=A0ABS5I9D4_9PROT|nr:hypothetical protein [Magnetospirillum sulfuroxidans]MBR9971042.1 hypothetical protein [Magnetospirillum sulfuroxidans]
MRRALPLLMLTLLLPACGSVNSYVQSTAAKLEQATNPDKPRPGLEPLYQPTALPSQADSIAQPEPASLEDLPFPPRLIGQDEAEALLSGDPAALRFLAIRRLAEAGLIPAADAGERAGTNMGALLPVTTAQPPAAGLFTPAPAPAVLENAIRRLWDQPGTQAQRDFLVDNVLPKTPSRREPVTIPDKQSARRALDRLDRLQDSGLITRGQKEAEAGAVQALLDGNALPEALVAAPPPEPVKPVAPKKPRSSGSGSGRPMERLQGGVSGELKIIPSPSEINAPALPAGFAGQAGIHLLSMGSASHGEQAWKALTTEHPDLAALTYKVVRADLGELGVTHRLIAGPLSAAKAAELCAALKPKGQTCQPTPFPP